VSRNDEMRMRSLLESLGEESKKVEATIDRLEKRIAKLKATGVDDEGTCAVVEASSRVF
jgi:hypothetical protein